MDSSKRKGKAHVPADPESDPSSNSSPRKSYSVNDGKYSKSKIKKRDTKEKSRKHKKQDLSNS